jgi:alpha-tubulin suppressor-like RCC1 family protein
MKLANGEYICWGENHQGSLGIGDCLEHETPQTLSLSGRVRKMANGRSHNLVLMRDGSLLTWGANNLGQLGLGDNVARSSPVPISMPNGLPVSEIGCGYDNGYAITTDGSIYAWGDNRYHQLGIETAESNLPVKVPSLEGKYQGLSDRVHGKRSALLKGAMKGRMRVRSFKLIFMNRCGSRDSWASSRVC